MKKFTKLIFLIIGLFVLRQANAQNTCAPPLVVPDILFSSDAGTTGAAIHAYPAGFVFANTNYVGGEVYISI